MGHVCRWGGAYVGGAFIMWLAKEVESKERQIVYK